MADELYKRLSCGGKCRARGIPCASDVGTSGQCKACGGPTKWMPHSGRTAMFCSQRCVSKWHHAKKSLELKLAREKRSCKSCGTQFVACKPDHVACSRKCHLELAGKGPQGPKPQPQRSCEHCGKEFEPNWRNPVRAMYCSKSCKQAAWSVAHGFTRSNAQRAIDALCRVLRKIAANRAKAERKAAKATQRALRDAATKAWREQRLVDRPCTQCGEVFNPTRIGQELCGKVCVDAKAKAMHKARRKADKARRRGAVVEVFQDIEILERDGWTCQICGVATPKKLRGTYKPNAPEVDHIIAIANGGAHARWNCQCACRACNGAKGAGKARGQMSLLMV
jgi:5-methylcytosine-specific restriction endonuclease McrA